MSDRQAEQYRSSDSRDWFHLSVLAEPQLDFPEFGDHVRTHLFSLLCEKHRTHRICLSILLEEPGLSFRPFPFFPFLTCWAASEVRSLSDQSG